MYAYCIYTLSIPYRKSPQTLILSSFATCSNLIKSDTKYTQLLPFIYKTRYQLFTNDVISIKIKYHFFTSQQKKKNRHFWRLSCFLILSVIVYYRVFINSLLLCIFVFFEFHNIPRLAV